MWIISLKTHVWLEYSQLDFDVLINKTLYIWSDSVYEFFYVWQFCCFGMSCIHQDYIFFLYKNYIQTA